MNDMLENVIKNKKKQIWDSLKEYLDSVDYVPTERLEALKEIARNECTLCDEILGDYNKCLKQENQE